MTSFVQYPVALRDGVVVEAEQTARGTGGLCCIECGEAMVRTVSPLGTAYFRHKKLTDCTYRPMTEVHIAIRDALAQLEVLALPPAVVTLSEKVAPERHVSEREEVELGTRRIASVVLERRLAVGDAPEIVTQQPDALVTFTDGLQVAVEVTVANPLSKQRLASFQARGLPCLEVKPLDRDAHEPAAFWSAQGAQGAQGQWCAIEGLPGVAEARERVAEALRARVARAKLRWAEVEAERASIDACWNAYERRDYERAYSDCDDTLGRYEDRRLAFIRWMRYWLDEGAARCEASWQGAILKEWSERTLQGYPAAWSDPVLVWLRREVAPEYTRRLLGGRSGDIAEVMCEMLLHMAARYQARSGERIDPVGRRMARLVGAAE